MVLGAKLGIKDRYLLKEALNKDNVSNVFKLLKAIVIITCSIEVIGAVVNFIVFSQYYEFLPAIGISVFHSISSFNNAGFDILGSSSLINYSNNLLLNINTMALIVLGGIGFIVLLDLLKSKFNYKKLTIHSKIVLSMTFWLIIGGTLIIKLTGDNITWLQALFQSVSSRTAGFATISFANITGAAILVMCIFMLIGASPSSTGGGIKTTTVYTMIKSMASFSKGKQTIVKNRRISEESKLTSVMILIIEKNNTNISLSTVIFETFSAFGTVGLSMGITSQLSMASKLLICCLMFLGRLGPITIMGIWNSNWNKPNVNSVEYLEEKIIIG